MKMVVAGSDCEMCVYCALNEDPYKITCQARDKEYYYGQRVPCEDRKTYKGVLNKDATVDQD